MPAPSPWRYVPARRLKSEIGGIMTDVTANGPAIITHRNKPVAVLMPIDPSKFERWLEKQGPDFVKKG